MTGEGGLVRKMSWCHGGDVHSFVEMVIFPEFDGPSKCLSENVSEATVEIEILHGEKE